jgi:hypothetical protein
MPALDTARKGIAAATGELARRGARVELTTNPRSGNTLGVVLPNRKLGSEVYVKTRASGTWQTDIRKGSPSEERPNERRFWLFVDLTAEPPAFYLAPAWWVENDIYKTYQRDLARFGGTRPRSPDSKHHGIKEERIAQWRDRWDLLSPTRS